MADGAMGVYLLGGPSVTLLNYSKSLPLGAPAAVTRVTVRCEARHIHKWVVRSRMLKGVENDALPRGQLHGLPVPSELGLNSKMERNPPIWIDRPRKVSAVPGQTTAGKQF